MSHKSDKAWLRRHVSDRWVQQAMAKGYRSRSAFKLLEIQQKDQIFDRAMTVVDLGAAPGGWLQVTRECIGVSGRIFAIDLLEIAPLPGVEALCGDFSDESIQRQLEARVEKQTVDLVICDIAPNLTGNRLTDQARSMHLNEEALAFAGMWLRPGGVFVVKVFQSPFYEEYRMAMCNYFRHVRLRKPQASRAESAELYLVGKARLAN